MKITVLDSREFMKTSSHKIKHYKQMTKESTNDIYGLREKHSSLRDDSVFFSLQFCWSRF